jgi:hypothetical protein
MLRKWNVDDRTLVEARIGMFGRPARKATRAIAWLAVLLVVSEF